MRDVLSILIVGSEILDGRIQDTNSQFLAQGLDTLGYKLAHTLSCTDTISTIHQSLDFLFEHSSVVIVSGGLGPTSDDLTTEAIANYCKRQLVTDEQALDELRDLFSRRKRTFDPANRKQVVFPEGSTIVKNPVGTAPGFTISFSRDSELCHVISLPGVPSELALMFEASVPALLERMLPSPKPLAKALLRVFGVPESTVGRCVREAVGQADVVVSYRAKFPEVQVLFKGDSRELVLRQANVARSAIGPEFVFSDDANVSFIQVVHELLLKEQLTISIAESCTGGLIGKLLTETPRSSRYFLGGITTYANEAKTAILTVERELIETNGAVSHVVALKLAKNVREKFRSDLALSCTGIAGPEGGTAEKPVGTFFIGVAEGDRISSFQFFYPASRDRVRLYAAYVAIDLLRRRLAKLPLPPTVQSEATL